MLKKDQGGKGKKDLLNFIFKLFCASFTSADLFRRFSGDRGVFFVCMRKSEPQRSKIMMVLASLFFIRIIIETGR